MKNFGKFHNERIRFQQGINIVCGGNESGKSTLYTFLQGIFFGIRRKRGTASRTDTYTRCLPWENPSWYEGSVLFEAGGKDFRLDRNFESRSQEAGMEGDPIRMEPYIPTFFKTNSLFASDIGIRGILFYDLSFSRTSIIF